LSRHLERECRRNLELIWLLEGLVPSYRTIAEFRRVNGSALRAVNRDFVLLCREPDLVGGETIGLDGSFFKASASDASITTKKRFYWLFYVSQGTTQELLLSGPTLPITRLGTGFRASGAEG